MLPKKKKNIDYLPLISLLTFKGLLSIEILPNFDYMFLQKIRLLLYNPRWMFTEGTNKHATGRAGVVQDLALQ